ncbi:MAG TPA: protein kinase, partial [Gemmataceae bacterium]|nr:protein kinase [Gemmataceae bacterium]
MSLPDDLGVMRTEAWDDLQRYLNRFEEAWKYAILHDQQPPDLTNYIPPFESQARGQVYAELVKTDLEYRWKQGQTPDLDSYILKYKELGTAETVPASLIFEEYRIRLMHGVQVKLGDYQKRFPVQYADLQKLVEMHPSVRPTPSLATSTPAPRSVIPKTGVLDFAPGAIIEGFELLQLLDDRGGFGEVWKAREQNSGVCFAVKRTKSSVNSSDVQRVRESLELLKGKELKNPYLLQIHRWFEYGRKLCIVMELASGGDLKHRLVACKREGQRGIPVMELFKYFKGLAEALDYLHDEGIQHRDIKPQNILLIEGVAKLADFDLVKEMAAQRIVSHTMGGTPAYQAPEMFDSDFVNRKSDQYCFAYTYTELRLGKLPFHFATHRELRHAHQNDLPNLEALPVAEREVLHKALAKKPQKRFDTCTAFIMALREAVGYTEEWQPSAGLTASAIVDFGRGAVIKGNNNLYELLDDKPIGEGGFGEVWKVRRQSGGGNYAIKRSKSGMDTDEVKRVLTSLQLFKDKNNPHLLQAIEWFRYGRKLCIVMELASGSLKERLTECKRAGEDGIPVDELLEYFKGLAEALDYLHGLGIQHRDIKPENILLVNGVAKLADFDLAKQMAKGRNVSYTMGGTVAYQAPEMFDGEFVDRKSDQYCFAYGYAELRLGKLPFDFSTQKQLREAHLQKAPPLDPLPAAEQEVLIKALAKKPQHRFASCMEFYLELEQAVRSPKPATTKPTPRKLEPRPTMPSDKLPTIKPQRPAAAGPVVAKTVLEPGARPVRQTPAHDRGSPTKDTDDGSIKPGTVVVGDPAMKTGVRQSSDTVEHNEQRTLKPRPPGRNAATDHDIRIKGATDADQWHDDDGERGGAKKWLLLAVGVLLIGGVIGSAMMMGGATQPPSPPSPPSPLTQNCDDERAAVTAKVDKLRQANKFDDAFGELDAFAVKQPQCAAEVAGLRLPLCEAKIDWLTTQDNFHGALKEVKDRGDLLGDKQAAVQTKVFVALKARLDGSKDKPHDYVLLEIVALYKNLLPEQQRPVLEWVKMAHAEMLGAANVTLKDAVACVADYGKTFGPAPSSWQCLVEMDKCLAPAGGGNPDHAFERYLALVKSPPEGEWDVPMEKLTGRLLKLADKDEKTMLALLAHKSDLSEHLNGMGLSNATKGAMVTLLDTGLNKKYLVEAALAYAQKNWAGCHQALDQIADKNTLLADQKQEHDALLALADAQLGKSRMQSSTALFKLLTEKDRAPAKRQEEMWNVLATVQANSFTLTTPQLLALEGAMAYAPAEDQPKVADHFFGMVNQFMKTTDVAKNVGPLKAQFDSVNKAQSTYDRLSIALKIYDRAAKAAPLERQIDLVLAAANAKVKDADERAFVVNVARKLLADKAVFEKAEHAKALYPVLVAYAELQAEPSAKALAYCELVDRIGGAGLSEIGLAEISTEVLKKAIDLRAAVDEKDKPALARLMAYQAGLIVDNK